MDQRVFDQLDQLERGARIATQPVRETDHDTSANHSAYERNHTSYEHGCVYDGFQREPDGFVEQLVTLDSFDERLLCQPDHDSRQEQASLGRARMTLPPASRHQEPASYHDGHRTLAPARFNVSRFALEEAPQGPSSSSPFDRALRSSPTFHASQHRPAPLDLESQHVHSLPRGLPREIEQSSRYQPVSAGDIDAELERYVDDNMVPAASYAPPGRSTQPSKTYLAANTGPPIVQGITCVPTTTLPKRLRALFPYPLFNAIQSKCFNTLYKTNENFVLSAPTGSGKTAALELAICRMINGFAIGSYKIVYQAPTKSLCSERYRDWQAKFGPLDLQCIELTGDTDNAQQRNVQHATIIITTPEKWDSMTRKWKDQQKLMRMVKLFLIDEVHILKENRGATLEAVVSRMKSVGSDIRFIALSATVPNSEDIATWLGRDPTNANIPAPRERFGEEFRPVRLQKHVLGYRSDTNDFAFDKTLNAKLPEVIAKYSQRKPIMVFAFTRSACQETAKLLSNWWSTRTPHERYWDQPRKRIAVGDKHLSNTISSGVAFHHAGLSIQDRAAVEKGYLEGDINVICCTSTLAVGVNLPCHMVIIKNTVAYSNTGCKEYSDLETMQMLGRAGRPQFDVDAVAVIMTKLQRVQYYEKMITGQEVLESCLHRNLIDHLNAEIGLGTITNASLAKNWLSGTFLYVRLKKNPHHYKLDGDPTRRNLEEQIDIICSKGIDKLESHDLISRVPKLHCTEFGDAMARYYLQFDTMKIFLALPRRAKVSEILAAMSQAAEFRGIRFRAGEKPVYKALNKNTSIKFPIPGTLDTPAHKISLVIQSVLGAVELPSENYNQRMDYTMAKTIVFNNANRLIRCVIDCQLSLEDSVTARNALALARSLGAQVWDDSPLHIKQLEGVGFVYVRKLVATGIKSIDDLENIEAHRIETALSRYPPFGTQLQNKAKAFPKLRVSIQMIGEPMIRKGEHVSVKLKAELGFLNDEVPVTFQSKPVYACLLAETSDGRMIHFARIAARKLDKGQDVLFGANLTSAKQSIRVYAMCDEVAGTSRHASLRPEIPPIAFPPPKTAEEMKLHKGLITHAPNSSKRRTSANTTSGSRGDESDEFGDANLNDADFAQAEAGTFMDIDDFDESFNLPTEPPKKKQKTTSSSQIDHDWQPTQLANGKWACNHVCRDKTQCKHLCCREGLDKQPKPPKATQDKQAAEASRGPKQTQLGTSVMKKANVPSLAAVSKSIEKTAASSTRKFTDARQVRDLDRLHHSTKTKTPRLPVLVQGHATQGTHRGEVRLSFLEAAREAEEDDSTDYGVDTWHSHDLPDFDETIGTQSASCMSPPRETVESNILDGKMLDTGHGFDENSTLSSPPGQGKGDGNADRSTYTNEDNALPDEPWRLDHDGPSKLLAHTPSATQAAPSKGKTAAREPHVFVGYSTDSAADEWDLQRPRRNEHVAAPRPGPSRASSAKKPEKRPQASARPISAQLRQEAERFEAALPLDEFVGELDEATAAVPARVEVEERRPSSPDSLKKWVMEEFGTEDFNFTW